MMKPRAKQPAILAERTDTLRHQIVELLSAGALSAREISEQLGVAEKEVLVHLEHVRLALRGALVLEPAVCLACGFTFRKRERLKGPGRCPSCRSEHIADPRFRVR
jgi:transcriptional regulator